MIMRPVVSFCEHNDEPLHSIKGEDFLTSRKTQLLKKDVWLMEFVLTNIWTHSIPQNF
jgi:hypothetical protein